MFRTSLEAAPNNGWACFGLVEVHKRRGETTTVRQLEERLARTWVGDPGFLDLKRL